MGRPSKLTEDKWTELGKRLAFGEKAADLSREYGVSTAAISKRFSSKNKEATPAAQLPAMVQKRPPGRESTFRQDVADEICARLSKGEPLTQICKSDNMPAVRTVDNWREARPEFDAAIVRARAEGYDSIAAECIAIADQTDNDTIYGKHGERPNTEWIQRSKLRIETRLKLLAKWDPKRYGEKLAIGGASDLPPLQQAVLNATMPADPQEASRKYQEIMGG